MRSNGMNTLCNRSNQGGIATIISLWIALLLLTPAGIVQASSITKEAPQIATQCSQAWYQSVKTRVPTGDGQGHAPDISSAEWNSVVEFKLGIRGNTDVPNRDSGDWCQYIEQLIKPNNSAVNEISDAHQVEENTRPSFSCDAVRVESMEAMICGDAELSSLDTKLDTVYAEALKKTDNHGLPLLKTEQRGWIKGRNECWKPTEPHDCVKKEYERRIAELQAKYRLVAYDGPVFFICGGNPANEVVVTFFKTVPHTLIAEHGDSVSLMFQQPSASGSKYQGRNESFWRYQGQVTIRWGYDSPEMICLTGP